MKANLPFAVIAAALFLAACSAPPKPLPAPSAPVIRPVAVSQVAPQLRPSAPPPPADWRDAPRTPGTWTWSRQQTLSVAHYADWLRLSCNPATRQVTLSVPIRAGTPAQSQAPLVITTTSARRLLSAQQTGGAVQVTLPASDPLLDAMAFSRGRFLVEVPGMNPLYLPSWTEVSRVIEDCRQD